MRKSISKFKKLFPGSILIAEAYCTLGTIYRLKEQFKESIRYYCIAEKHGEQNISQDNCVEVFFWIYGGYADNYKNMGNFVKAAEYLKKKKALLLRCGYETDSDEVSEIDRQLTELE